MRSERGKRARTCRILQAWNEFGFYSQCNGKLLKGCELWSGMVVCIFKEMILTALWKIVWKEASIEAKRLILRLLENSGRDDWVCRPWISSGTYQPHSNAFQHWLRREQEEADGRTESASGDLPGSGKDTLKQKLVKRSDLQDLRHTRRAMPANPCLLILSPMLISLDSGYQFGHDQETDLALKCPMRYCQDNARS